MSSKIRSVRVVRSLDINHGIMSDILCLYLVIKSRIRICFYFVQIVVISTQSTRQNIKVKVKAQGKSQNSCNNQHIIDVIHLRITFDFDRNHCAINQINQHFLLIHSIYLHLLLINIIEHGIYSFWQRGDWFTGEHGFHWSRQF